MMDTVHVLGEYACTRARGDTCQRPCVYGAAIPATYVDRTYPRSRCNLDGINIVQLGELPIHDVRVVVASFIAAKTVVVPLPISTVFTSPTLIRAAEGGPPATFFPPHVSLGTFCVLRGRYLLAVMSSWQ